MKGENGENVKLEDVLSKLGVAEVSSYICGALALQHPAEVAVASKLAKKTIIAMERNGSKLPALSAGEVYYWVSLAGYSHMVVDELKEMSMETE